MIMLKVTDLKVNYGGIEALKVLLLFWHKCKNNNTTRYALYKIGLFSIGSK